jgi:hypothetical protein
MLTAEPRSPVSVVIPCYNQARFLVAAIRSAKAQPVRSLECLVVDDGSTDDTAAVALSEGATLLVQHNAGVSAARNAGLAAATGELVVFLDADDELVQGSVARSAVELESDHDAAAVVGRCLAMDSEGRTLPVQYASIDPARLYQEWLPKNFVWTPGAAIFRRDALRAIGGFPQRLGPAADYAVYLRLARAERVRFIDVPLARYRQHGGSMSTDPGVMLRATLAVLRRERNEADPALRPDIARGVRQWREFYGTQMVDRLRSDLRHRRFGVRQARTLATLLSHCPALALRHMVRKSRRMFVSDWSRPAGAHVRADRIDRD